MSKTTELYKEVWIKIYAYKHDNRHTLLSKYLNVPRTTIPSIIKKNKGTYCVENKIRTEKLMSDRIEKKSVRDVSMNPH